MSKVKFRVVFDVEFDTDELEAEEREQLEQLTVSQVRDKINSGFENVSYDFFGESLAMLGLQTPEVESVNKVTEYPK